MDIHSLRYRLFGLAIIALVTVTLSATRGQTLLSGFIASLTGLWAVLVWWGYALEARALPEGKAKKGKSRRGKPRITEFGRPEWSGDILLWSDRLLAVVLVVSILSLIVIETVLPLRDLMYGVRPSGLP